MLSQTRRSFRIARFLLVMALLPCLAPAAMGQTDRGGQAKPTPMVVTGDDVYVRTGPGTPFYPFGTVDRGDIVQVIGEKNGWARVLTVGPAFSDFFGYVRYTEGDGGRFRVTQNGAKGMTLGRVELIAPNVQLEGDPIRSWKRLSVLPVDTELTIRKTEAIDGQTVHTVSLPRGTEGWINMSLLREATEEDLRPKREPAEARAPTGRPAAQSDAGDQPRPEPRAAEEDRRAPQPQTERPRETAERTDQAETDDRGRVLATEERELDRPTDEAAAAEGEAAPPVDDGAAEEPERSPQERLEALEEIYAALRKEPIETAELNPLREMYLGLAADPESTEAVQRYAEARAEQLAIWADLQKSRRELATLQRRLERSAEQTEAERRALASTSDYIAVGRLATSRIFDGENMPKLYRLQDAGTGRTIAYIRPSDEWDLTAMLGQLVGVVGERQYDAGLRLYLIDPSRMDIPPR